jgi:VanZ family protein
MINLIKKYWLIITMLLMAAIATLSLWPVASLPQVPGSDKTHHFIAYGSLMFAVALRKPKHWLLIALGLAAFSGVIELIQPYVNRYGEWLDLAANIAGLACGVALAKIVDYFSQRYAK